MPHLLRFESGSEILPPQNNLFSDHLPDRAQYSPTAKQRQQYQQGSLRTAAIFSKMPFPDPCCLKSSSFEVCIFKTMIKLKHNFQMRKIFLKKKCMMLSLTLTSINNYFIWGFFKVLEFQKYFNEFAFIYFAVLKLR